MISQKPGAHGLSTFKIFLVVSLALLQSSLLASARLPYKIDLVEKSYTLSAEISVIDKSGQKDRYVLEEFHSAWQRKSRISYQVDGPAWSLFLTSGTIYSDDVQAFEVKPDTAGCTRLIHDVIDQALHLSFIRMAEDTHLIGTARLLLFIEENSDKFKPEVSGGSESRFKAVVNGGDLTLTVSYLDGVSLPLGVPTEVLIEKKSGFIMLFRAMRVLSLPRDKLIFSGSSFLRGQQGDHTDDLKLDVFAIDRGLGCSKDSKTSLDFHEFLSRTQLYRFSFSAQIETNNKGEPFQMVVGYDADLETLRTDTLLPSLVTSTLVSYRHDRLYNVMRRHQATQVDAVLDVLIDVRQSNTLDNDVLCVVQKASASLNLKDSCKNPHSLGEMLLGATKITYLGHALVRGIEAYAFEAYDSQLPVWLEQPSVYRKSKGAAKTDKSLYVRAGAVKDGESELLTLTSVYYFSRETPIHDNMILGNKLLLIEIFVRSASGQLKETLTMPIYDFSWKIQTLAPNGARTEDFFSLGNECLSPVKADNHYARIDAKLKGFKQTATDKSDVADRQWLNVSVARNLALVRATHEQFQIPSSMIYDLESRYQVASATGQDTITLTMRAAERNETPVMLSYVGRSSVQSFVSKGFRVAIVLSFQVCYLIASHKREETIFGYEPLTSLCCLYGGSLPPENKLPIAFDIKEKGPLEVYTVRHDSSRKLLHDDYITKIDDIRGRLMSTGRVILTDPSEVGEDLEQRAKFFFGIEDLEVSHLNEKMAYDLDEHHLDDVNKFSGLGLLPNDEQNKVVSAGWTTEEDSGTHEVARHATEMSFEQCQQACLIDAECQAFSSCIVDGQVECVLTSVDFRAPTLVLELMLLQDRRLKLGEISTLSLDEISSSIHVKKHPTCELHNKLYKDLFQDSGIFLVSLHDRLLTPVSYLEQCAEICYKATLETMRSESAKLKSSKLQTIDDLTSGSHYVDNHCGGFFYLDERVLASKNFTIAPEQLVGVNNEGIIRGYCLMSDNKSTSSNQSSASSQVARVEIKVELHELELDFSIFFEKSYGVSLLESKKTPEEQQAYDKIYRQQEDVSQEHVNLMRNFVERGDNTGLLMPTSSIAACARHCLTQFTALWPACRSFDVIETLDKSTTRRRTYCAYNTVTMSQLFALGRTEMVRQNNQQERVKLLEDEECTVWHYEPAKGLVASSLEELFQVSLTQTDFSLARLLKSSSGAHLSSLGLFLTICIILILGTTAGVLLSSRGASIRGFMSSARRDDKQILVTNSSSIEFDEVNGPTEPDENENK